MEIAKRYLDPKIRVETGLEASLPTTPKSLRLEDSALEHLIRWYAREAGVRSLEKLLGKVFRKAAIKIVSVRHRGGRTCCRHTHATLPALPLPPAGPRGKEGRHDRQGGVAGCCRSRRSTARLCCHSDALCNGTHWGCCPGRCGCN